MLANVYLDALDKELEGRGLGFCRYADDCNIYVGSQPAAQRVMEKIVGWIEEKLRLKVNLCGRSLFPETGDTIITEEVRKFPIRK